MIRAVDVKITHARYLKQNNKDGLYRFLKNKTMRLLFSLMFPDRAIDIDAGTKVMERTIEPSKAMITVCAIGLNIFPSTPVKVKIGK